MTKTPINETKRPLPLAGVRVLDVSQVMAGPYCSMLLADLGADVIKVETPGSGDVLRWAAKSAQTPGMSPAFFGFNHGKRSIALDLKQPDDNAVMRQLLAEADVFVANVRGKPLERLGLDYDSVRAIRPDIVYVHCAGFGAGGAYGERQAYDDLIQAASGFAALSEQRDGGRPTYSPSLVADKVSGLFAANATMAALLARAGGQGGQFVQVPMFECFTWFNMVENLWGETFIPGNGRMGYTRSVNPRRRPYPTKDSFIAIVPYNDRQWAKFFELGGRPNVFDDPRFSTYQERTKHTGDLYALIEEVSALRTTAEWLDLLAEHDIPAMKYNRMADVLTDPHLADVGFFEEMESPDIGTYRSMKHPVHYAGTPASNYAHPPMLDADGDEIRAALGM